MKVERDRCDFDAQFRLSKSFFMRDFLFSDIAAVHGLNNLPDDPDLAIAAGTKLCEELLEPLQERFGRIAVRSAFRSCEVNGLGNEMQAGLVTVLCRSAESILLIQGDRRDDQTRRRVSA
ncbi:hypothetical protein [Novosphingobium pentaromativorans]|uniref:Uncharacterized protein n=1 Tax=Novosphingobium pentaromativorans US6-1 TaxID=1088721 RepID=G6EJ96_9SPHN|nr:hypothetical protein [Novosphingobium pentaromativorans]EHJ58682.1 hypothetical protein NSU_4417 [Novosphingobium pentaromativorans US6-1]